MRVIQPTPHDIWRQAGWRFLDACFNGDTSKKRLNELARALFVARGAMQEDQLKPKLKLVTEAVLRGAMIDDAAVFEKVTAA